jgi:putative redox protein
MEAKNPDGNSILIDASPEIGGKQKGVRPTELLLMGVAGCSGIDILSILEKQKQSVSDFQVLVDGAKEKFGTYSLFTDIQIVYKLQGDPLDPSKVRNAIELSLGKYCSVSKTMEKTAKIGYKLFVNNEEIHE